MKRIVTIGAAKEVCPKCGQEEWLETGLTMVGCYNCSKASLSEQGARAGAYARQIDELAQRVKYLEAERSLDKTGENYLRQLLNRERARLSLLSFDGTSLYSGYDSTVVSMGFGEIQEAARSNVRQAVDAIALKVYGENWVEEVLSSSINSWLEDPEAAPGMNSWHGPNILERTESELGEIRAVAILPAHSEQDVLKFLGGSGPINEEQYAGEEETE